MKLLATILFSLAVVAAAHGGSVVHCLTATDARGVRRVFSSADRAPAAWKADAVFHPKPDYPYSERAQRNEGVTIIRLDIDIKTGKTTYVTMLQSSGSSKLDEVALRSLAKWQWKPGTWKQVEVPVVFTMSGHNLDGWYP